MEICYIFIMLFYLYLYQTSFYFGSISGSSINLLQKSLKVSSVSFTTRSTELECIFDVHLINHLISQTPNIFIFSLVKINNLPTIPLSIRNILLLFIFYTLLNNTFKGFSDFNKYKY